MNVNQFYLLLFAVSVFGGLSFMLLIEVCKLRQRTAALLEIATEHRNGISMLWNSIDRIDSKGEYFDRNIVDLQLAASLHDTQFRDLSKRLKLAESTAFFVVRRVPEAVSKPGEVHPFAADAFVTVSPEAAAA